MSAFELSVDRSMYNLFPFISVLCSPQQLTSNQPSVKTMIMSGYHVKSPTYRVFFTSRRPPAVDLHDTVVVVKINSYRVKSDAETTIKLFSCRMLYLEQ